MIMYDRVCVTNDVNDEINVETVAYDEENHNPKLIWQKLKETRQSIGVHMFVSERKDSR